MRGSFILLIEGDRVEVPFELPFGAGHGLVVVIPDQAERADAKALVAAGDAEKAK